MKILHVITGLTAGGAETMLVRLIGALAPPEYEHTVAALIEGGNHGRHLQETGVAVHSLRMKQGRPSWTALIRLRRLIRDIMPDVVHGWMYHGNLAATMAVLGGKNKPPLLWSIRHSLSGIKKEKLATQLTIRAGAYFSTGLQMIIYNSAISARQHEDYGYNKRWSHVIPNGFDTSLFKPDSEARQAVRAALNIPQNSIVIGLIARYHPIKDHDNFFRAAALLAQRYPDVHFLLAGSGVTEEQPIFANIMHNSVCRHRIHLLGERHDIPQLTAALDIASSSSWSEAFSNSIGEAMACAVPCVGTNVGDTREIIGDTGFAVPPCNAEALAAGWHTLIEHGSQGRKDLGEQARKRILDHYSLATVAQRYAEVYTRVTGVG